MLTIVFAEKPNKDIAEGKKFRSKEAIFDKMDKNTFVTAEFPGKGYKNLMVDEKGVRSISRYFAHDY